MKEWCVLADRVIATHGRLFTISDFSTGSIPAETRQLISYWPNVVHVRGAAIFGAGWMTSVAFSMIARATTLLRKHSPPTAALKTEREARAWVAVRCKRSQRRRHTRRQASARSSSVGSARRAVATSGRFIASSRRTRGHRRRFYRELAAALRPPAAVRSGAPGGLAVAGGWLSRADCRYG